MKFEFCRSDISDSHPDNPDSFSFNYYEMAVSMTSASHNIYSLAHANITSMNELENHLLSLSYDVKDEFNFVIMRY